MLCVCVRLCVRAWFHTFILSVASVRSLSQLHRLEELDVGNNELYNLVSSALFICFIFSENPMLFCRFWNSILIKSFQLNLLRKYSHQIPSCEHLPQLLCMFGFCESAETAMCWNRLECQLTNVLHSSAFLRILVIVTYSSFFWIVQHWFLSARDNRMPCELEGPVAGWKPAEWITRGRVFLKCFH